MRVALATIAIYALVAAACSDDHKHDRMRVDVERLSGTQGIGFGNALSAVVEHGRPVIPYIETALQSAEVDGRLNLITALRKLGDGEAIPLVLHRAQFDEDKRVRVESEWTLKKWGQGADARAKAARAALRKLQERRGDAEAG